MPQAFVSATTQAVGSPGYLIFTWTASGPTGSSVSVSFTNVYARVPQIEVSPIQKINIAVGGGVHIFQLSPREPLTLPIIFENLPWNDYDKTVTNGEGLATLLSFVRYTLNYYQETFQMTTPDGLIETVRYMGGIDSFREAEGQVARAQRWNGQLTVMRVLP